jgi:Ni,Fe-hydrogenase III small subunit
MMFFAGTVPVQPGDLVELVVKAGVLGLGPDTQRSVHRVYEVVEDAPVIDVSIPGTGVSPYPLLRGALVEKSSTSDYNAIMGEVDELINSIK